MFENLPLWMLGYTRTSVPNNMNHIQRAVSYITPRSAATINGNAISHAGIAVQPYRSAYVASPQRTHAVFHRLESGAIPAGGARTISRLAFSGAVSPNSRPPSNIIQSLAWAQTNPSVSAIAQNLGYSLGKMQGSPSVGFIKTGLAQARARNG